MTLWELLFTSKKTVPPHLGFWYFLLPTSLVIIAVLSIRFPHVSSVNNVFGHWALFANCLIYLVRYYKVEKGDTWKICRMTLGVNSIILIANLLTGGNYGFLSNPPVIGDHGALVNYLIVTSLMTGILVLVNQFVKYKLKNRQLIN